MSPLQRALGTWLGTLAEGVIPGDEARAGLDAAAAVVGEERLEAWCRFMAAQPYDVVLREQVAAIEVCIWMAHADDHLHPEEQALVLRLIDASALDDDARLPLVEALSAPPSLDGLEARLTHPVLRELLLSLAWRTAGADGHIADEERRFFDDLARRLDVPPDRALQLRS